MNNRQQPDIGKISQEIIDAINRRILPNLAPTYQQYLHYQYRSKPQPSIKLFVPPSGTPAATIARRKDGAIYLRISNRAVPTKIRLTDLNEYIRESFRHTVTARILDAAHRDRQCQLHVALAHHQERASILIRMIREIAREFIRDEIIVADEDGILVNQSPNDRNRRINHVIRNEISSPQTLRDAALRHYNGAWNTHAVSTEDYNSHIVRTIAGK